MSDNTTAGESPAESPAPMGLLQVIMRNGQTVPLPMLYGIAEALASAFESAKREKLEVQEKLGFGFGKPGERGMFRTTIAAVDGVMVTPLPSPGHGLEEGEPLRLAKPDEDDDNGDD